MPLPLLALGGLIAAGAGAAIGGSFLGASSEKKKLRFLRELAATPEVNIGQTVRSNLALQEELFPQAYSLASRLGVSNQEALNALLETASPGSTKALAETWDAFLKEYADDRAWLSDVARRGAAIGIGRFGAASSPAAQIRTLRLTAGEREARTGRRVGLLSQLLGSLRLANTPSVQALLGPTSSEAVGYAIQQRGQKMGVLSGGAQYAGGSGSQAGSMLSSLGGTAMGIGTMGLLAGTMGGGGAGTGTSGGQQFTVGQWMQQQNMLNESQPFYGPGN